MTLKDQFTRTARQQEQKLTVFSGLLWITRVKRDTVSGMR